MEPLEPILDRLARMEPTSVPFLSVYLDAQADQHGKDNFGPFLEKELTVHRKSYPLRSPERASLDRDAERIERYLREDLAPEANGVAIFACAGASDFFEAVQLDAPIERNRFQVATAPQLFALERLRDRYPRCVVVLADTHQARLLLIGLGTTLQRAEIQSEKVPRPVAGGWSQMKFQRHADMHYEHHAKEVADGVTRLVDEQGVAHVILAGDEVVIPLLRPQLPKRVAERVIAVLHLDIDTPEDTVRDAALDALRRHDAEIDRVRVSTLFDAYRSGGLGIVGPKETLAALCRGQVHELLLSPTLEDRDGDGTLANALATAARRTSAHITFVEDPQFLAEAGGVGGILRYRT